MKSRARIGSSCARRAAASPPLVWLGLPTDRRRVSLLLRPRRLRIPPSPRRPRAYELEDAPGREAVHVRSSGGSARRQTPPRPAARRLDARVPSTFLESPTRRRTLSCAPGLHTGPAARRLFAKLPGKSKKWCATTTGELITDHVELSRAGGDGGQREAHSSRSSARLFPATHIRDAKRGWKQRARARAAAAARPRSQTSPPPYRLLENGARGEVVRFRPRARRSRSALSAHDPAGAAERASHDFPCMLAVRRRTGGVLSSGQRERLRAAPPLSAAAVRRSRSRRPCRVSSRIGVWTTRHAHVRRRAPGRPLCVPDDTPPARAALSGARAAATSGVVTPAGGSVIKELRCGHGSPSSPCARACAPCPTP